MTETNEVKKSYCSGCPYDFSKEATEMAYNLGCLPTTGEISFACQVTGKSWACHSEPNKVCCGYAAHNPDRIELPLLNVEGIHGYY